jgi:hypothetical protein
MTNLAGNVAIGQLNACVVRAARLDSDCSPTGGANGGIVTAGLVSLNAEPDIETGTVFEPKNACGDIMFTYEQEDKIKRYNLSGEFGFHDYEMMALLFGGSVILGKAGGSFAGKVVGYADRLYSDPPRNGVYLEIITTAIYASAGSCVASDGSTPVAIGHVFGNAKLTRGASNFGNEVKLLTFAGKSTNNPNLYDGPWNDYPGAGYAPNSPYFEVGYTQAQYDAILADIADGYQTLPAGS